MLSLSGSVGKGGNNNRTDVITVQKLLNNKIRLLVPLQRLTENGDMNEATIQAITEFQRKVVKLYAPDGRIDPDGRTWRSLKVGEESFTQLPQAGIGYYVCVSISRIYGTEETIKSIKSAAQQIKNQFAIYLGIGDLSFEKGGQMSPHKSHQEGRDVDIRPLRQDNKHLPVNISDTANYSQARTRRLVEILRKDANLEMIFFNDQNINGVIFQAGHSDHLHVRFKK